MRKQKENTGDGQESLMILLFEYLSCSGSTSKQGKKKTKKTTHNIKTKAQEKKEREKKKGREDDINIARNQLG